MQRGQSEGERAAWREREEGEGRGVRREEESTERHGSEGIDMARPTGGTK